jgi:hypothetical protein
MGAEVGVDERGRDVADAPHRHVPISFSDPYVEFDVEWVVPVCECGVALAPRRAVRA